MILILCSVNVVYPIDSESFLHLRDKSYLIMVYDPFKVQLNSVC